MTATINDFVEEWLQHFKPNKCKNIQLEVIKLCKEKRNFPSLKPDFLPPQLGNGPGFAHQSYNPQKEPWNRRLFFYLFHYNIPEAT